MSSSSTIAWLTDSNKLPKTLIGWAGPAVAVAALVLGITNLAKSGHSPYGERKPPVVSSWIPWLGSANAIDADPDKFIKAAQKQYPGGIFGVKIGGNIYYYVTDIKLINSIYKQPKNYTISTWQMQWAHMIFGISNDALMSGNTFPELAVHLHKFLSPAHVGNYGEAFATDLHSFIRNSEGAQPLQQGSSIIIKLKDFMYKISYRATALTVFGPTFNTSDQTIEDFDLFDSHIYKVAGGYPSFLLPSFKKGHQRVIANMTEYLEAPHQAGELIAFHENAGRDAGFSMSDLAGLMLCSWWPTMANVPFSSYWVIALSLEHPDGVQPIIAELDKAGQQFMTSNPALAGKYQDHLFQFFQTNPSLPLLSSTISETLRYTTDSYSMRDVTADQTMLGPYTFKKGDTVICVTRGVHMDKAEFGEDAEDFVPTRFMKEGPIEVDGKGTEAQFNWMPFGGGISMCSGRHFATLHAKLIIATMLKTFRFEVDKAKSDLKVGRINRGFGIRRPEGDLTVKVTRL